MFWLFGIHCLCIDPLPTELFGKIILYLHFIWFHYDIIFISMHLNSIRPNWWLGNVGLGNGLIWSGNDSLSEATWHVQDPRNLMVSFNHTELNVKPISLYPRVNCESGVHITCIVGKLLSVDYGVEHWCRIELTLIRLGTNPQSFGKSSVFELVCNISL